MLWSSDEAALATGGTVSQPWTVSGISIDTRTIHESDLFVALKDVRDGHDFVAQALEKGASAALVSRVPDGVDPAKLLIVDDVLAGLEAMAAAARARFGGKVIGVTGSVGKTSTKEMLRHILGAQGIVHAAEKSYNNHWGVPLTLARMPRDADFAVIEIGMNHPGEIAPLSRMTKPDVAVITIVAPAHLEAFEDIEGIAREKAAIFDGLSQSGMAIVNGDMAVTDLLCDLAPAVHCFGQNENCDWKLADVVIGDDCVACHAHHDGKAILYKVGAAGTHFAMNGLAALASTDAVGGDIARAAVSLADWHPPSGRGQRHFVQLDRARPEIGVDLIDDAYNANPASVGAALEVVAAVKSAKRRIAILGDMKELGSTGPDLHADLATLPAIEDIDVIHCIGPLMGNLYTALPVDKRGIWAETGAELTTQAHDLVQAGDIVMVKGSLSMKMAQIVDAIRNLGQSVGED
ncbi:MAG: UDP-N-acetylmuramoyl-tripeptide--D-alanyl-D-alanine ligase [Litoreibacter sp.]